MKLNIENIEKFGNILNQMLDETEQITTEELGEKLNKILTDDEKILFNQEKYSEIITLCYALSIADQSGILYLESTKDVTEEMIKDCGYESINDPEVVEYHKDLKYQCDRFYL